MTEIHTVQLPFSPEFPFVAIFGPRKAPPGVPLIATIQVRAGSINRVLNDPGTEQHMLDGSILYFACAAAGDQAAILRRLVSFERRGYDLVPVELPPEAA